MKRSKLEFWRELGLAILAFGGFTWGTALAATNPPSDWEFAQTLAVTNSGLIEIDLPIETLDAARPDLGDLRVLDDAGREMPYLIDRSLPTPASNHKVKSLQTALTPKTTVLNIETGLAQPIEGITLASPAASFLKAVQIEGSRDQARWETLAKGQVIFRQANGVSQLHLPLAPAIWPFLRLTVDDERSEPVPFSGATVRVASVTAPTMPVPAAISSRTETPGETRLALSLPGAHLQVARLEIVSPDRLFTREVTVATTRISENSVIESPLVSGVIYRLAIDGEPVSSNLTVQVEAQTETRSLVLLLRNHDSQPLQITEVRAERRPVRLLFLAPAPGRYLLICGNRQATAPRYDLANLASRLRNAPSARCAVGSLSNSTAYRPPEALPAVREPGTALDTKAWQFRKSVKLAQTGVQELELDLEVLAEARPGFEDLRVVQAGKQVPYVLVRTLLTRSVTPKAIRADDPKTPRQSRWSLVFPQPSLPLTRLVCRSPNPLFQRDFFLSEEASAERGDKYQRSLGRALWTHTPNEPTNELVLALSVPPLGCTLFLETDNADNPPIALERFEALYPVTKLLFKTLNDGELYLYYGNRDVSAPNYDLALVAHELENAQKRSATLGAQERLKKSAWGQSDSESGNARIVFWVVLVAVVAGLLLVITRLLPSAPPPEKPPDGT